jgi:hypothetical protein
LKKGLYVNELKVIDDFLADWKEKAANYYLNALKLQGEASKEKFKRLEDNRSEINKLQIVPGINSKEYKTLKAYCVAPSKDFADSRSGSELGILARLNYAQNPGSKENLTDELNKILDKEVANKKAKLIARVEKKAGKIIDASLMTIGNDGSLNGYITGKIMKVHVHTIYAGGYNIQCLHFRVLVK